MMITKILCYVWFYYLNVLSLVVRLLYSVNVEVFPHFIHIRSHETDGDFPLHSWPLLQNMMVLGSIEFNRQRIERIFLYLQFNRRKPLLVKRGWRDFLVINYYDSWIILRLCKWNIFWFIYLFFIYLLIDLYVDLLIYFLSFSCDSQITFEISRISMKLWRFGWDSYGNYLHHSNLSRCMLWIFLKYVHAR